uniref:Vacuolar protein sorting-associated protein 26 n=1 Tax=Trichuris muris TaxID=70415 RepID=A0A5S6QVU4_TRIMR
MSFFGFGQSAEIDIHLDDSSTRATVPVRGEDGITRNGFLFYDGETISGTVSVRLKKPDQKLDHNGIKIEFIGHIEVYYDRGNHMDFISLVKELAQPGELLQSTDYRFEFTKVEKPYESYCGSNVKLRYFLRVTIAKRISEIIREMDLVVHTLSKYPEADSNIKMEVGIEDCLHIEFEYNRSKYHLKDVIVGKIYFLLVRIKIKFMEIAIIKRETIGTGTSVFHENETVAKYEIMDGAPVKGESIPIRLFLSGYDLTPTMREIHKRFSVRYFLNLVLVDEEERRYFKQQEITLWRKADKIARRVMQPPTANLSLAKVEPMFSSTPVNAEQSVPPQQPPLYGEGPLDWRENGYLKLHFSLIAVKEERLVFGQFALVSSLEVLTMTEADQKTVSAVKRFIDNLSTDLYTLCTEGKKKFPQIKDAAEIALAKVRNVNSEKMQQATAAMNALTDHSSELLMPFTMGCDSRLPRLVQISLSAIQRFVTSSCINDESARSIVTCLWSLANVELEELKVLQTVALLVSANDKIRGADLAKCLVICFRLNFAKDSTVINTASATVRQLVSQVFERARRANDRSCTSATAQDVEDNKSRPLQSLPPSFSDAAILFQDLCRLVNTENPVWLLGIVEMTRTLGLDLIELLLSQNECLFSKRPEFIFLLKESMCPLMIKMFALNMKSPSAELRLHTSGILGGNALVESGLEKPYFPITVRLMRLVNILHHSYSSVLITECEIFLSLLIKFLDSDKLDWQRALSLEVIEKVVSEPALLRTFCVAFDMKSFSAKVIKELMNAVNVFALSIFDEASKTLHRDDNSGAFGDGAPVAPGFLYHGVPLPMVMLPTNRIPKSKYLDLVEKGEPPSVPFGYFLTLVYGITCATVNSLDSVAAETDTDLDILKHMLDSCWKTVLSSVNVMLEASSSEEVTETLLKLQVSMLSLACKADNRDMRSTCVSFICQAALPTDISQTTIAILPPSSATPTQKNLQAGRVLLSIVLNYGTFLDCSWFVVFRSLQGFLSALRLKPMISDSDTVSIVHDLLPGQPTTFPASLINEVPWIVQMLSDVTTRSSAYSDQCLMTVLSALCELSKETLGSTVPSNKDVQFFAVWQLVELTVLNLHRLDSFWKLVSPVVLGLCSHSSSSLRVWGSFAFSRILRTAVGMDGILDDKVLRKSIMKLLADLSDVPYEEVHAKQLDCVLYLLRTKDRSIHPELWPSILKIIGSSTTSSRAVDINENTLRLAFQALRIVGADFLSQLDGACLQQFMLTDVQFGSQIKDLNISLSAVGNLWTVGDFLYRNHPGRTSELVANHGSTVDQLLLCLYHCLSDLCIDPRPPVRKSACQTLLSTIMSHGGLLQASSWRNVFWEVLFPLLLEVKNRCFSASTTKATTGGADGTEMLMHHSRDTESKQWAETSVLTVLGVVKVLCSKAALLNELSNADFTLTFCMQMYFLEELAKGGNAEVSVGALKSFQDLLQSKEVLGLCESAAPLKDAHCSEKLVHMITPFKDKVASVAFSSSYENNFGVLWQSWLRISSTSLEDRRILGQSLSTDTTYGRDKNVANFVNCLLSLFVSLFPSVYRFVLIEEVPCLMMFMRVAVLIPIITDSMPFMIGSSPELSITHQAVLHCLDLFFCKAARKVEYLRPALPFVFDVLLEFFEFAYKPPDCCLATAGCPKTGGKGAARTGAALCDILSPFAERALQMAVDFYRETALFPEVIEANVAHRIFKQLAVPLMVKRQCSSKNIWHSCVTAFLSVARVTLAACREKPNNAHLEAAWPEVLQCLENFLFAKSESKGLSIPVYDETHRLQLMECEVVDLIRCEVLPSAKYLPADFVSAIMDLLYRGCIDGHDSSPCADNGIDERKNLELSSACFKTLLLASVRVPDLVQQCANSEHSAQPTEGPAALKALMRRCHEVVSKYPTDERLAAGEPLPSHRTAELVQVFKTIVTMVETIRQQDECAYVSNMLEQLGEIYPLLVDCVKCKSDEVKSALLPCLKAFQVFIKPLGQCSDGHL